MRKACVSFRPKLVGWLGGFFLQKNVLGGDVFHGQFRISRSSGGKIWEKSPIFNSSPLNGFAPAVWFHHGLKPQVMKLQTSGFCNQVVAKCSYLRWILAIKSIVSLIDKIGWQWFIDTLVDEQIDRRMVILIMNLILSAVPICPNYDADYRHQHHQQPSLASSFATHRAFTIIVPSKQRVYILHIIRMTSIISLTCNEVILKTSRKFLLSERKTHFWGGIVWHPYFSYVLNFTTFKIFKIYGRSKRVTTVWSR